MDGTQPSEFSKDPFSIANKQNEIHRSASALRINNLRKTYDTLIKLSPPREAKPGEPLKIIEAGTITQEVNNPFTLENCASHISLSVYNQPEMLVKRRPRPVSTQDQLLRRLPGWKAPVVKAEIGPDGEPMPVPVSAETGYQRTPVLYGFKDVADMISKDGADQFRQEQMLEVYSIKERLAHDGCPANLKTLKRALLMPEEGSRCASAFSYPNPKSGLMANPWPKKTKKKKKKGKKR